MKCIGCNEAENANSVQFTVFRKVVEERVKQKRFEEVNRTLSKAGFLSLLTEELGEIAREINDEVCNHFKNIKDYSEIDPERAAAAKAAHTSIIRNNADKRIKEELYQLAALCFQWLEELELQDADDNAEAEELPVECGL